MSLDIPFNISILELNPEKLKGIKPVRALDIFDESKKNYHEDGLYSSSIFGRSGDELRDYRFSYIDVKIEIFHPILFKSLIQLKSLYEDIMAGREFAIWSDEKRDFEKATALNGETGFHFFIQHWKKIEFQKTNSDLREQYILLVDKFKDKALTSKIVVLPAGLRDLEFSDSGRTEENEINPLYRKLISISNIINETSIKQNPEIVNSARWSLQSTFNEIYDLFTRIIKGKKKLVLGKWASRKVFNGTRNVITSMDTSLPYLGDPDSVTFNSTIVGLYQLMKAMLPVTKFHLKNGFLSKVFVSKDIPVRLVNTKTLKAEDVNVSSEFFDRWTSDDGLDKVIETFREESLRHKPVMIGNYYLGLMYKGPDGTFKIIQDIDEVPDNRDKAHVTPLTLCELFYCSIYHIANKYPGFVTRYPIASFGSIYPSYIYLKTTNKSEVRRELTDEWIIETEKPSAKEFPLLSSSFMNSLIPHSSRIVNLNADFDGDTCSLTVAYSDTSLREIKEFFNDKRAYLDTSGKIMHSTDIDTVAFVLHNLTGP